MDREDSRASRSLQPIKPSETAHFRSRLSRGEPQSPPEVRSFYGRSKGRRFLRDAADRLLGTLSKPMNRYAPPKNTVHFFASLTHIQRAKAMAKT